MATRTVYVRASRADVLTIIRSAPSAMRGAGGVQEALLFRVGQALLGRVKAAFVAKAAGGADEAGLSWQPLSKATVAYKRRHPVLSRAGNPTGKRLPRSGQRASKAPSYQLTAEQWRRWWQAYRHYLRNFSGDKAHAAGAAWLVLKAQGARTLMEVYGGAKVEILRDTGLLLNTLTPGVSGKGASQQVFRVSPGEVVVGTRRAWAWTHHYGVPGKIPRRPLWPPPSSWPPPWWDELLGEAVAGAADVIIHLLGGVEV